MLQMEILWVCLTAVVSTHIQNKVKKKNPIYLFYVNTNDRHIVFFYEQNSGCNKLK